jgi:stearoyl-CoA desaturase (delta-9 desaturase)
MTGGLGICLGFHRLLTHGSFETYRPVRWFFATLGTLAGEGPPIMWVAAHRKHHIHSDQDEDPHTPNHGGWWSHVLWMLPKHETRYWSEMYRRYAPDMLNDKFVRFLNRNFLWLQLAMGLLLFASGWLIGGVPLGVSLLVYGLFVRSIYVLHVTWFVNSASHIWGYQNYETDDNSRNLWWVGLLAFGEGWHNNHHADQRRARHGHRWWELDLTYAVVWLLERCGLAWNVVKKPSVKAANSVLEPVAGSEPQP